MSHAMQTSQPPSAPTHIRLYATLQAFFTYWFITLCFSKKINWVKNCMIDHNNNVRFVGFIRYITTACVLIL